MSSLKVKQNQLEAPASPPWMGWAGPEEWASDHKSPFFILRAQYLRTWAPLSEILLFLGFSSSKSRIIQTKLKLINKTDHGTAVLRERTSKSSILHEVDLPRLLVFRRKRRENRPRRRHPIPRLRPPGPTRCHNNSLRRCPAHRRAARSTAHRPPGRNFETLRRKRLPEAAPAPEGGGGRGWRGVGGPIDDFAGLREAETILEVVELNGGGDGEADAAVAEAAEGGDLAVAVLAAGVARGPHDPRVSEARLQSRRRRRRVGGGGGGGGGEFVVVDELINLSEREDDRGELATTWGDIYL
ncbi:P-loop containing nucleoside triphosphatehydrolases superfamily protein [Striga asiatica]|uniref:P-loop containing nucleoside triphosphatehydrolases superfamily protein n=1 Tax=Striga asiatica TaxID=4170 RepID=A0A5A7Q143_STRAF|nr:P-loop containing nucleoside triphosphatehydrolases superfamily protein [Striga asiatica]